MSDEASGLVVRGKRAWTVHVLDAQPTRWRERVAWPLRRLWLVHRRARRHLLFIRASGMAYMSLVAMVPSLMLLFGMLHATGQLDQNPAAIERLVFESFLGGVDELRNILVPGLMQVDLTTVGVLGVVGLVAVAVRLYLLGERTYNEVFDVQLRRPLWARAAIFIMGATLLPVLLSAMYLRLLQMGMETGWAWTETASVMFVQFTILAVAMRVLPQVRVRWHAFAAGTLVSLALFDLALYAFGLYTSMVQLDEPVAVVYGSLAAMPLFLLWVYWAWLSVLIGIEVAAVVQDHDRVYALERAAWDARLSPDAQTGQK